jgi:hypothetical protein
MFGMLILRSMLFRLVKVQFSPPQKKRRTNKRKTRKKREEGDASRDSRQPITLPGYHKRVPKATNWHRVVDRTQIVAHISSLYNCNVIPKGPRVEVDVFHDRMMKSRQFLSFQIFHQRYVNTPSNPQLSSFWILLLHFCQCLLEPQNTIASMRRTELLNPKLQKIRRTTISP